MPLSVYPGGGWPGAPRTGAGQSTGGARGPGAPPPARAPHLLALLLVALHRPRVCPVAQGAVGAAALPHAATLLHLGVAEGPVGAVGTAQGHVSQGDAPLLAALAAVPQRVGLLGVAVGGRPRQTQAPTPCRHHPSSRLSGQRVTATQTPAPVARCEHSAANQAANAPRRTLPRRRWGPQVCGLGTACFLPGRRPWPLNAQDQPLSPPQSPSRLPALPPLPFIATLCAPDGSVTPAGRGRGSRTQRHCLHSCHGRRRGARAGETYSPAGGGLGARGTGRRLTLGVTQKAGGGSGLAGPPGRPRRVGWPTPPVDVPTHYSGAAVEDRTDSSRPRSAWPGPVPTRGLP